MSRKKLFLLNVGWAGLATTAYFLGASAKDNTASVAPSESAQLVSLSSNDTPTADTDRRVSRMFQEIAYRSQTSNEFRVDPIEAAEGLTQALSDLDTALAREEERLADFARTVTPETALSMMDVFMETPRSEITDRVFLEFLQSWGTVAGQEAVEFVVEKSWTGNVEGRWYAKGIQESVTAGWASEDPTAAIEFTNRIRDNANASGAISKSTKMHLGVLDALLESDLDWAIDYSKQFHAETVKSWDQYTRKDGLKGLGSVLSKVSEQRGLRGLESWVDGIDAETPGLQDYKAIAANRMLEIVRQEDPARAAAWIAVAAEQDLVSANNLTEAARVFADTPENQLEWIKEQPGKSVNRALREPFTRFVEEDFYAAGDWLAGQPLGPKYDYAISAFAKEAASYNPQAARVWANRIDNDWERRDTLRTIEDLAKERVSD